MVSGTLDPDATGTYLRAIDTNGQEAWTREDSAWSIWYENGSNSYMLTEDLGHIPETDEPYWTKGIIGTNPTGTYDPSDGATRIATVGAQVN